MDIHNALIFDCFHEPNEEIVQLVVLILLLPYHALQKVRVERRLGDCLGKLAQVIVHSGLVLETAA